MQMQPMLLRKNQLQVTGMHFAVHEVKSMNLMDDKNSIVILSLSHNGGHFAIGCIKLTLMHMPKPFRLNHQGF